MQQMNKYYGGVIHGCKSNESRSFSEDGYQ